MPNDHYSLVRDLVEGEIENDLAVTLEALEVPRTAKVMRHVFEAVIAIGARRLLDLGVPAQVIAALAHVTVIFEAKHRSLREPRNPTGSSEK